MLIEPDLVTRIEHVAAADNAAVAEELASLSPSHGSKALPAAGGQWVLFGRGMYVNRGIGMGVDVDLDVDDLTTLEMASGAIGVDPEIEVCPWVQPSLLQLLAGRGYHLEWFRSVLIRPVEDTLDRPEPAGVVTSAVSEAVGLAAWQNTSARGFGAADGTARDVSDLYADALMRSSGSRLQLATVDGQPAGAAAMTVRSGIATLSGMSTAPWARRRGVQAALVAHRLSEAADAGCDVAISSAVPGGASERNLMRLGFALAYTKVGLRRPR